MAIKTVVRTCQLWVTYDGVTWGGQLCHILNVKMKSRKHGFGLLPIRNSVGKIERILRTTYNKPTGYTVVHVLLALLCKTRPYYDYETTTYEPISYPSEFPYFCLPKPVWLKIFFIINSWIQVFHFANFKPVLTYKIFGKENKHQFSMRNFVIRYI